MKAEFYCSSNMLHDYCYNVDIKYKVQNELNTSVDTLILCKIMEFQRKCTSILAYQVPGNLDVNGCTCIPPLPHTL